MAIRTYEIILDAKNDILPEIIFGRQGDKTGAVQINGTIVDGGVPYDLTGKSLAFKATTAKGTAIVVDSNNFNIVDASNGKFTYLIPNALWSEAGRIDNAYFSVYNVGENQAESTLGLIFVVKKAVDMTQERANDYITIVDKTIKDLAAKLEGLRSNVDQALENFSNGDFYNKQYIDDFANENIPQNDIIITHNLNKMMLAVVYYYSNAIGTETGGLASGPTGSFGGMPLKTVASQTEIVNLNQIKVTIPNNFKLTGTPTLGGDGNYFINQNEYTLKFKLVYYE